MVPKVAGHQQTDNLQKEIGSFEKFQEGLVKSRCWKKNPEITKKIIKKSAFILKIIGLRPMILRGKQSLLSESLLDKSGKRFACFKSDVYHLFPHDFVGTTTSQLR